MNYDQRNSKFLNFWQHYFNGDIKLISEPERPIPLFKNKFLLASYVKKFTIYFLDHYDNGTVVYRRNLSKRFSEEERVLINDWYKNSIHKEYFSIEYKETGFFYCGSNTIENIAEKNTLIPVFSRENFKVYTKENALEVLKQFQSYNLQLK